MVVDNVSCLAPYYLSLGRHGRLRRNGRYKQAGLVTRTGGMVKPTLQTTFGMTATFCEASIRLFILRSDDNFWCGV